MIEEIKKEIQIIEDSDELVTLTKVYEILDKYNNQDKTNDETDVFKENKALKLLVDWMIECDFGLDNIMDGTIDENKFDDETKNMNYSESLIHYAKMYLEQQYNLGSDKDVKD